MIKIKDKIQFEVLEIIYEKKIGLIAMATGVGKSKIAIDLAKKITKEKPNSKILLVVPTEELRDKNWKDEFTKWNAEEIYLNNTTKVCYASVNRIKDDNFDLVILDEAHNVTKLNSEFFKNNKFSRGIALTATPPKDREKREILLNAGFKTVYELSLDDAVKLKLVSPFNIKVIFVKLNKAKNIKVNLARNKSFMTSELKQYEYISRTIARLLDNNTRTASQNSILKFSILKRMRMLYNSYQKEHAAKYILENIIPKEERTLIFASTIKQAKILEKHTFNSKSNNKSLKLFTEEKINRLSCVKALDEGINIPNLDNALVVQLTSKDRQIIQRIGRIVRYRDNHIANIYIIVVKDTVDEKWMRLALEGFNENNIKYVNYEDIKNEKKNY